MFPFLALTIALAAQPQAEEPTAHALLVGVGRYPALPEGYSLKGPENDVQLVRRALVDVLDFDGENIRTLVTGEDAIDSDLPTRDHILAEIERIAVLAEQGRVSEFVLVLCGHGTQLPDAGGDELDGRDEVFLPCDVTKWDEKEGVVHGAIRDDELESALAAVAAGADRVVLLVDSCHSGTLLRGHADDGVVWRELTSRELGVPDDAWEPVAKQSAVKRDKGMVANADRVIALYGARSDERAPEMHLENTLDDESATRVFGVFTHSLVKELYRSGGEESFDQLLARMRARYNATGRPSPRPTGEGPLERPVRLSGTAPSFQVLHEGRKDYVQNYGRLHDAVEGTEFEVFEPGRSGDPQAKIGVVRVTVVGLDRSDVERIGDFEWPRGLAGAPAKISKMPVSTRQLRIAYEAGDGQTETLRELEGALESYPGRFVRATETRDGGWEDCDWVVREAQGDEPPLLYRPDVGTSEGFVLTKDVPLEMALSRIFRVRNMLELTHHESYGGLPAGVEVELRPKETGPGGLLMPGTPFTLWARNLSSRRWFLAMHAIDSAHAVFGIKVHDSGKLEAGTDWKRIDKYEDDWLFFTDDTPGLGYFHVLALDVSQQVPDLSQGPLDQYISTRGAAEDGFSDLLSSVSFEPRTRGITVNAAPQARAHAGLVEYSTDWPALRPLDRKDPRASRGALPRASRTCSAHDFGDASGRALVVEDHSSVSILFDLDADSALDATPEEFDAELVIRRLPTGVVVFYDVDGLVDDVWGRFEQVFVDFDGDGRADVSHLLSEGEWSVDDRTHAHLLQIDRFREEIGQYEWNDWRERATATLRAYFNAR